MRDSASSVLCHQLVICVCWCIHTWTYEDRRAACNIDIIYEHFDVHTHDDWSPSHQPCAIEILMYIYMRVWVYAQLHIISRAPSVGCICCENMYTHTHMNVREFHELFMPSVRPMHMSPSFCYYITHTGANLSPWADPLTMTQHIHAYTIFARGLRRLHIHTQQDWLFIPTSWCTYHDTAHTWIHNILHDSPNGLRAQYHFHTNLTYTHTHMNTKQFEPIPTSMIHPMGCVLNITLTAVDFTEYDLMLPVVRSKGYLLRIVPGISTRSSLYMPGRAFTPKVISLRPNTWVVNNSVTYTFLWRPQRFEEGFDYSECDAECGCYV
jgi:hypothetical protein